MVSVLINLDELAEKPTTIKKAIRVALASIEKERKTLAVDANMRRVYKATYSRARYADNRTQDLDKAKEILETILRTI